MFPLALVLVALAAPPTTPAEALRKAEELYAVDKFGEAEPLFKAALASDQAFERRRAYTRLIDLYLRSGRSDKAVKISREYRAWLKEANDAEGLAALDLLSAEFLFALGYSAEADKYLVTALESKKLLPLDRQLEAYRLRAAVAGQRREASEKDRWAELEAAAADASKSAVLIGDLARRVTAGRYLAEARLRRGDIDGGLAALDDFFALQDKLEDPLGRRDTLRLRATLLTAKDKYKDAVPAFKEALDLHRKHQPNRRLIAGDILAEWSAAARSEAATVESVARRDKVEAALLRDSTAVVLLHDSAAMHGIAAAVQRATFVQMRDAHMALRDKAAAEYRAALGAPADDPDAGGALAALVRLQSLTRSARQFRKALDVVVTAGERWSGDPLVDGRLKSDRGGLELMTAAYQTAQKSLEKALADLDAADPPNLRALPMVLVNLATAELALDAPEKADALLKRCDALYRKHNLTPDAVRAEADYLSGAAAARRSDYAAAMAHFRAGLKMCDTVGKAAEPVRFNLHLNIALIHKEQGDSTPAAAELKRASDVLAGFPEPDDASGALIDAVRADMLVVQGRIREAAELVPKIEAVCTKDNLGPTAFRKGYLWATARHVRALELLARRDRDVSGAEAIWAELVKGQRDEKGLLFPRTLNYLGICAELRGADADATKLFEDARKFQAERPRCPPVTRAITLWRLAVLTDKAGKKAEAKALLNEVFDVADKARLNTFGEAAQRAQFFAQFAPAFDLLAAWHARDGDGDALLRTAARSRSRTLLDQMLAAGVDPRDRLTGDGGPALLKREADARRNVSRLRAKAMLIPAEGANDDAKKPLTEPEKAQKEEAKKLLAELEAAQKEYTAAWLEIANADPLTRVLADSKFTDNSIASVRKAAHQSGGVVLTYLVGRDHSFAVLSTDPSAPAQVFKLTIPRSVSDAIGDAPSGDAVAGAGLRGVTLKPLGPQPGRPPEPMGAIESVALTELVTGRLANQYLRNIADPAFNPTRGVNLVSKSPGVVNPSAPEVLGDAVLPQELRNKIRAANAKRVVLIPDGALHKLPFECLLLSATPKPVYALDELPPVCYAPSIAALAVVLNRERKTDGDASLLTVGDPAYAEGGAALPRLPFTAVESERVGKAFPTDRVTALTGASATEREVVKAMPGKRFLHLAAHGFADEQYGNAFGSIALAPPLKGQEEPSNDGFLTLHEITRLKLTGCELTVLSACVTNVGPQRQLEAGVTLSGAFLGAGSRGVMATCWSVDDQATAELMSTFFGAVRPAMGKGTAYPEALKAARLTIRGKRGWEAPFFWAPFVYVGPPD